MHPNAPHQERRLQHFPVFFDPFPVFNCLMLQFHQTSRVINVTQESSLEPLDWDTTIFPVELWSGFQSFSSRKDPAKSVHSRQTKNLHCLHKLRPCNCFSSRQDLDHKKRTQKLSHSVRQDIANYLKSQLENQRKKIPEKGNTSLWYSGCYM